MVRSLRSKSTLDLRPEKILNTTPAQISQSPPPNPSLERRARHRACRIRLGRAWPSAVTRATRRKLRKQITAARPDLITRLSQLGPTQRSVQARLLKTELIHKSGTRDCSLAEIFVHCNLPSPSSACPEARGCLAPPPATRHSAAPTGLKTVRACQPPGHPARPTPLS